MMQNTLIPMALSTTNLLPINHQSALYLYRNLIGTSSEPHRIITEILDTFHTLKGTPYETYGI